MRLPAKSRRRRQIWWLAGTFGVASIVAFGCGERTVVDGGGGAGGAGGATSTGQGGSVVVVVSSSSTTVTNPFGSGVTSGGGTLTCEYGTCDITGTTDCAAIAACSGDIDEMGCNDCQGIACGQGSWCDDAFPCINNAIVLRGCCHDSECGDLGALCGRATGTNNVCVLNDAV
jgi:hypothetical protein